MTAAAFAKGFLDLEGKLTPILASLVSKHKDITKMLDETSEEGRTAMDAAKAIINSVLTSDLALTSDEEDGGGEEQAASVGAPAAPSDDGGR